MIPPLVTVASVSLQKEPVRKHKPITVIVVQFDHRAQRHDRSEPGRVQSHDGRTGQEAPE